MDDTAVAPVRHKMDVHAYHKMGDAGVFAEDARVELIDGEIFDMAPIGQGHAGVVGGLTEALVIACARRAIVWPQNPVRLDRLSEPQPDLAVLRRRADFYTTGEPPGPGDVLLLIEVADSSLRFDRTVKLPLYARAGIPEVWIVNLRGRVVEAHSRPLDGRYADMTTHQAGERIELAEAPEITVQLDLVFG